MKIFLQISEAFFVFALNKNSDFYKKKMADIIASIEKKNKI